MFRSMMVSTRTEDRIASYDTPDAATLAVSHLVALDYDPKDVAIVPAEFEKIEEPRLRGEVLRGFRVGVIAAACAAAAFAVLGAVGLGTVVRTGLPALLVGAAVGAVGGPLVAATAWWRRRQTAIGPLPQDVAPSRFDVVVRRRPGDARHMLARWRDPAAPPAGWRDRQPA